MAWTYLEADGSVASTPSPASAGSPRPSPPGATPSPTASGSAPARPSSSAGCSAGRRHGPQSGTTPAPSTPPTSHPPTSSPGGFPARTSAPPARASAWQASVPSLYREKASASLAHFDPKATCSLKTSQLSLFEGGTSSLETLPRSGMTLDGSLYPLSTPTPPPATGASGGSAWRTEPEDLELSAEPVSVDQGRMDPLTRETRDIDMWPTPSFMDGALDSPTYDVRMWKAREIRKARQGISLQFHIVEAIRMAREPEGWAISRDLDRNGDRMLPPDHVDHPGRGTSRGGRTISPDSRVLNPLFLAMLMGFGPTDVTRLEPMVMESTWYRQGSRSGTSSRVASSRNIRP